MGGVGLVREGSFLSSHSYVCTLSALLVYLVLIEGEVVVAHAGCESGWDVRIAWIVQYHCKLPRSLQHIL